MSYQVMARKYRPQSFDQMIGQNHISQTLTNSIKNDRLPHALLFTGLRGTGKTSSARILAKTLRCLAPVNFTPCNQCQSCVEITAGRAMDVIEIDGASNNGVDAMRDLRDNVMFSPSSGKYKIFIIDEVHMLSTSAFNALLKTLEEPPAHVVFMLATTEVHKIPQTILSRCQRFDFRRIPLKQIAEYLKTICDKENFKADKPALWLIARQGDGSMRDSLSLLDQVISFTNGNLTEAQVGQVLGLTERSLVFEVFDCLVHRKDAQIVSCLQKISQSGQNPSLFLEDLSKMLRHSLILKTDATATMMIDLPDDEINLLIEKIKDTTDSDLHLLFDMMMKSLSDLSRADDSNIVFEIALLRMSQAPKIADLKTLLAASPTAGATPPPKLAEESLAARAAKPPLSQPAPTPVVQAPPQPKAPLPVKPSAPLKDIDADQWLRFIMNLKAKDAFYAAKIESLIFVGCQNLKIGLQAPINLVFLTEQLQNSEMRQNLQGFIDSEFGEGYTFEVLKSRADSTGETAHTLATKKLVQAEEKMKEQWQLDPRVQKAKEVFKGEIKLIKRDNA